MKIVQLQDWFTWTKYLQCHNTIAHAGFYLKTLHIGANYRDALLIIRLNRLAIKVHLTNENNSIR